MLERDLLLLPSSGVIRHWCKGFYTVRSSRMVSFEGSAKAIQVQAIRTALLGAEKQNPKKLLRYIAN